MADPLSITTGVVALLKATYSVGTELKQFCDGVGVVNSNLLDLKKDVEGLTSVLKSMRTTFENITAEEDTGHVGNHWQNIARALQDGTEILGQLHTCFEEVDKETKFLDRPRKQLRLNLAAKRIGAFRQHIQSYRDALQLSLQTIILWYQVSHKRSAELIPPVLSDLQQDIRKVALAMNQRIESLQAMVITRFEEVQITAMCNLRTCVQSAASIVSSVSTTNVSQYGPEAGSTVADSDFGHLFPADQFMLQRWVETESISGYDDGASTLRRGSDADVEISPASQSAGSDSDDDLELEIVTGFLKRSQTVLSSPVGSKSERKKAESYLDKCLVRLSQMRKTASTRRLESEVFKLLLREYLSEERWLDARPIIAKKLAMKERYYGKDDNTMLADLVLLARLYSYEACYTEAELHARRAFDSYRKGDEWDRCRECLELLVSICRSDRREDDAEAYEVVLESRSIKTSLELITVDSKVSAEPRSDSQGSVAIETSLEESLAQKSPVDTTEERLAETVTDIVLVEPVTEQGAEDIETNGADPFLTWGVTTTTSLLAIRSSNAPPKATELVTSTKDSPQTAEDDVEYPCKGCGEILEEGKAFELAGNRWHINCFKCKTCGTLLDSDANLLLFSDGSLVCDNCMYNCNACGNKIEESGFFTGEVAYGTGKEADTTKEAYCAGCFKCRNCKRKIENLRYARTSQGIFCMSCHENLMARRRRKARLHPILCSLSENDERLSQRRCKAVWFGDLLVGKASAMRAMFEGSSVTQLPYSTVSVDCRVIINAEVIELGMCSRYWTSNGMASSLDASTNVAVFCFAIDNPDSLFYFINKWISDLLRSRPWMPVLLVGCKKDLRENEHTVEKLGTRGQHTVTREEAENIVKEVARTTQTVKYLECSARTKEGLKDLSESIGSFSVPIARKLGRKPGRIGPLKLFAPS